MLTKNFQQLKGYDLFKNDQREKEIFTKILSIEKSIKTKHFVAASNKAAKVLEDILLYAFSCKGKTLQEKIKELSEKVDVISIIKNALHNIKIHGNQSAHGTKRKTDELYEFEPNKDDVIVLLKSLFLIILFLTNYKNDSKIKKVFNSDIYHEKIDFNKIKDENIENINDDIKSYILSISQFVMLKDYKFNIPTYQRGYAWTIENINKLLKDIEHRLIDSKTHYMGSIAIANDEDKKILRIIDGQQRITTSMILLRCFYNYFISKKISVPQELQEFIVKIKDVYINQKILSSQKGVEQVLKNNLFSIDLEIKNSNAFKNYEYIMEWLNNNESKALGLYTKFVSNFQIGLLSFDTLIENEMVIFENLNTGGTVLEPWDLIKNHIFTKLEPSLFLDNEKEVNQFIVDNFQKPWKGQNPIFVAKQLNNFFTQYNRLHSILNNKQVWMDRKNQYEQFKESWNIEHKFTDLNKYKANIGEIIKWLNIYVDLFKGYKSNESKLHKYSHILDFIFKDDIAPLLMFFIYENSNFENGKIKKIRNEAKLLKVLKKLEKYFIRVDIVNSNRTSQANMFDKYLLNCKDKINGNTLENLFKKWANPTMPTLNEFQTTLAASGSIKKGAMVNMLINVECKLKNIDIDHVQQTKFSTTWEHILAKKLDINNYGEKISQEKFDEGMDRWQDSVGNALILSQNDNSKAGNKSFLEKTIIYKNYALAKGSSNQLIDLTKKKIFTFKDIEKRSKQLANFIAKNIYKD